MFASSAPGNSCEIDGGRSTCPRAAGRATQRAAILCVAMRLASKMRAEAVILGANLVDTFENRLRGAGFADRQREARGHDALDDHDGVLRRGHARGMIGGAVAVDQIDHQAQDHGRLVLDGKDALPTALDPPGDRRVRRKHQPVAMGYNLNAVVGDEPAEPAAPLRLAGEILGETALSRG